MAKMLSSIDFNRKPLRAKRPKKASQVKNQIRLGLFIEHVETARIIYEAVADE